MKKMRCLLSKTWKFLRTSKSSNEEIKSVNCVGRVLDVLKDNHLMLKDNPLRKLSSYWPYGWRNYMLPQMLAVNLKSLSLTSVKLNRDDKWLNFNSCYTYELNRFQKNILSPTLKSLTITGRDLSDWEIEQILSTCPALEVLRLHSCGGTEFTRLNIFSPTLKKLEIRIGNLNIPTIDISAPYARELKINGDVRKTKFRLRDIKSLVRASVCFRGSVCFHNRATSESTKIHMNYMTELLQSLRYVKELEIGKGCLKSLSMLEPEGLNIPTSTWRCLILTLGEKVSIPGIFCILKSSPCLETLTIKGHCSYFFKGHEGVKCLENIDLVFHHLKTINITLYEGEPLILVKLLLKNAKVLQKMTVSCKSQYESKKLCKALLAFPRASPEAKVVLDLYC